VGAIIPGPLLGCVIKAGLGGVCEAVTDLLLESVLVPGSLSLAAEKTSLATSLSATVPRFSELVLWPAITKKNSEMRGRGKEFFGGTLG